MSFFDKLFRKGTSDAEDTRRKEDDYEVKKSKKSDIIIAIISVVCAIIIWIYSICAGNVVLN
ncbi:MAG: hypothetical protein IJR55_05100 [Clostridia bacterium]|nr:hypothetical protein [Clostridia bacterium]